MKNDPPSLRASARQAKTGDPETTGSSDATRRGGLGWPGSMDLSPWLPSGSRSATAGETGGKGVPGPSLARLAATPAGMRRAVGAGSFPYLYPSSSSTHCFRLTGSAVPAGTWRGFIDREPTFEKVGYYRSSLRDFADNAAMTIAVFIFPFDNSSNDAKLKECLEPYGSEPDGLCH